jgi:hypothetical protein
MNLRQLLLIALLLCGFGIAAAETRTPTLEDNLRRLKTGYFPVTMQRSGGNLALLRESNIDTRICVSEPTSELVAAYQKDGLPLYVYIFDGDGTLMLRDFWEKRRAAFMANRTVETLKRDPSLFDPAVRQKLKERVRTFAQSYKACDVLAMCVAHEASVTGFASPLDFDFSDGALAQFRQWLKTRYPSVEKLNATWKMSFKSFDEVLPPITDAMIDREYPNYPHMQLAPWYDFREFTDDSFVDLLHELAAVVRAEAPAIPTSVTVSSPPSAYGGWDYARLLQPGKIDVLETYEFPGDKGLVRGLTAGATVNVCSYYVGPQKMRLRAWRNFFNGERSNFFDAPGSKLFPQKDKLAGLSAEYKPDFDDMRKYAALIGEAKIEDAGVRMIYSQPSVRCYWFIDNKPDAKTYPNRGSKWEIDHNSYMQALGGWQDLLGELAVHPLFESYLDLRAGKFRHGTPRVLIANLYCCVGDAELALLKKYVEDGGCLVIDESFAMFDEHGNARAEKTIPLAALPREKLRATFGQVDVENAADAKSENVTLGKGKVVLLKTTVVRYGANAKADVRLAMQRAVAQLLAGATVLVENEQPACNVDIYRYRAGEKQYAGVCSTTTDDERALKFATLTADGKLAAPAQEQSIRLLKNRGVLVEYSAAQK